jgi:hypothetical protein
MPGPWAASHPIAPTMRLFGLPPCYAEEVNEEVREQLKAAVEECQSALRNRAEESD